MVLHTHTSAIAQSTAPDIQEPVLVNGASAAALMVQAQIRHLRKRSSEDARTCFLETWGAGVETQENKMILYHCQEKTKTKNIMSVGRRRLLQHYWYKVPLLQIINYHLMSVW